MQPKPKFLINVNLLKVLCGSSLITLGIFMIVQCTSIFNYVLNAAYSLHPNSFAFNLWKKYPMPLAMHIYVWNWTNPHEIYNHSIKPRFVQMGPYVFDEDKIKLNITWNDNNDTLTYMQRRIWHYNKEKSVGSLDDKFTSVNPTSLSAAHKIRNWNFFMKKGFSLSLAALAPTIHITKSIGDALFNGYEDPLMKMAKSMPFLLDDELDFDLDTKFGWFKIMNNSARFGGVFNMATGKGKTPVGQVLRWKNKQYQSIFKGECSKVQGSSGEFYPNVETVDSIKFFSSEICRSVALDFEKKTEMFGVTGRKFHIGPSFLDNGTLVKGNECFCDGECAPYGLVNASACRYGTPAFVSLPHFLDADASYRDAIEGMQPEKEKHEFYLTFEPKTKIPLRGAARLQLVLRMHPIKGVTIYEKVPTVFIPVLWFEQVVELPSEYRVMIKFLLGLPSAMVISGSLTILTGFIMLILLAYKTYSKNVNLHSKIHHKNLRINLENNAFLSPKHRKLYRLETFIRTDEDEENDPFMKEQPEDKEDNNILIENNEHDLKAIV